MKTGKRRKAAGVTLACARSKMATIDRAIAWREWEPAAFAEAEATGKPILLAIGAVWCHWCHVMDRTSYSDPNVIATIAERYVPIRVDTDRRPDVNARYNLGGWPTTAILTPAGEPLTGATYIPPEQLRALLKEVADAYREHKDEIAAALAERGARPCERPDGGSGSLEPKIVDDVRAAIEGMYDPPYGGFGREPKFPMSDALEFLATLYARTRDPQIETMLSKTVLGMARGGMYDHVEGGFFRYSTTRDWTVPHFEKMAEDHAGLLRVYAHGWRLLRIEPLRETLVSAVDYVRGVLRDPASGFFAGSQDADEAYYALPLEGRRERSAPFVDRTVYSGWNASLASGLLAAARALDDEAVASDALEALDRLHARLRDGDGLLFHYQVPNESPRIEGLLTDQVAYLRALLDAHEYSGERRFRDRAVTIADAIARRFDDGDGALVDRAGGERLGRLALEDRPLADNALLADSLLRLGVMLAEERYGARAEAILRAFAAHYAAAGIFAASYAKAVARALWGGASVAIVGLPPEADALRESVQRLDDPFLVCVSFAPSDSDAAARGLRGGDGPIAYPCRGSVCGAPARTVAEIASFFSE